MNELKKVINGGRASGDGSPPSDAELQKRMRQLRAVQITISRCRRRDLSPRLGFAIMLAVAVSGVLAAGFYGLGRLGFGIPGAAFIVAATFFVTSFLAGWRSKRAKTWAVFLDQQLADYDPIDRDAYRGLQQRTRALGYIDTDAVELWRDAERHAIRGAAGCQDAPASRFLKKKV